MSRGALQGGRELRLRVRHKKPKRLLRSWYNLLGQDQGSVNGSDEPEEVGNYAVSPVPEPRQGTVEIGASLTT